MFQKLVHSTGFLFYLDGVKKNEFSLSELVWRQPSNIRIRRQKRPKRLITHIKRRNKRALVNSFLEKYESFLLYLHIYISWATQNFTFQIWLSLWKCQSGKKKHQSNCSMFILENWHSGLCCLVTVMISARPGVGETWEKGQGRTKIWEWERHWNVFRCEDTF